MKRRKGFTLPGKFEEGSREGVPLETSLQKHIGVPIKSFLDEGAMCTKQRLTTMKQHNIIWIMKLQVFQPDHVGE